MNNEPLAIELYETLSGGFALGEADPLDGESMGKLRRTEMSLHNAITITDLRRFYRDPDHPAELTVTLTFPPLGECIECYDGTLHLFKPGGEPGVRLMVYRFGFLADDGTPYFFQGKKRIHDGSSLPELWDETTHLYSHLYRGYDERGELCGAGTLQIGIRGMLELARCARVLGGASRPRKAEMLARFGYFFLGELWGAYRGPARPPV